MSRTWKIRILWLVLGVMIGCIPACSRWWEIDSCLDQGGRWNEEKNACEF